MSEDIHSSGRCEICKGMGKPLSEVPSGPVQMCPSCGGFFPTDEIPQSRNSDIIGNCLTCQSPAKSIRRTVWYDSAIGRASKACTDNWHWTGNQLVPYSDGTTAPRGWEWNEGDDRYMRELDAAFAKPLEECRP